MIPAVGQIDRAALTAMNDLSIDYFIHRCGEKAFNVLLILHGILKQ